MPKSETVTATVSGDLQEFVDRLAEETDRSRSGVVRAILEDYREMSEAGFVCPACEEVMEAHL